MYDCESYDDYSKYLPSSPSVERAFCDLKIKSSSSDSEYSDIESSSSKIKSYQASVRQIAYQVLQAVVKVIIIILLFSKFQHVVKMILLLILVKEKE